MNDIEIHLSEQPDGYGFFYGTARKGDAVVRVNVLPPAFLWAGDMQLEDHKPDATHWCVFADGELLARIERQEDVGGHPGSCRDREGDGHTRRLEPTPHRSI